MLLSIIWLPHSFICHENISFGDDDIDDDDDQDTWRYNEARQSTWRHP